MTWISQPKGRGWFRWGPQWFYSWPIRLVRGHDEFCRNTVGIVTWAGALFYAWPCHDSVCDMPLDDSGQTHHRCHEHPCPWCGSPLHVGYQCPKLEEDSFLLS